MNTVKHFCVCKKELTDKQIIDLYYKCVSTGASGFESIDEWLQYKEYNLIGIDTQGCITCHWDASVFAYNIVALEEVRKYTQG